MKRSEVDHVLRAAAAIAQEHSFVVVGSRGSHRRVGPEAEPA